MDTCNKVSKYLLSKGYECNIIGVPKTIDNDLYGTDHCPGYGSAAKYVATTLMELCLDATVYDKGQITIVEIMGRNAGWLTAASSLAYYKGLGPDLIYLPEIPFDIDKFVDDVKNVIDQNNGKCIVALSEGIKTKEGLYVAEAIEQRKAEKDSFGHTQLGGVADALADLLKQRFKTKVRAIEFSLLQRCAAHLASKTDVEEAFMAGVMAVRYAVQGETDKMVVFERQPQKEYKIEYKLMPVELAANAEKKVPLEWIINNGTALSDKFIEYALPLIQGDTKAPLEEGLPRMAKLKKVLVRK